MRNRYTYRYQNTQISDPLFTVSIQDFLPFFGIPASCLKIPTLASNTMQVTSVRLMEVFSIRTG